MKIKINLNQPLKEDYKICLFIFTIDLAAIDYAEHIAEYQTFKIDLSSGELHSIGKDIIDNKQGLVKLYTGFGYWMIEGEGFTLGYDSEMGEDICEGINEKEAEVLKEYCKMHFNHICESVLGLASQGIDLSQYQR